MAHFTTSLAVATAALWLMWPAALWPAWPAGLAAQARERVAYVSVVDRKTGAPLDALTPGDIVIREDRVTREVLKLTRAAGPMPVAILVDNSAAAEPAIPDLRTALTTFLGALGDVGPVAIIEMGERPTVLVDYTSAPAALAKGAGRLFARPNSGTTLIEAVMETSRGIARREGERAAIVVLSANGPEQSTVQFTVALELLQASGATMHAVVLSPPGRKSFGDAARQRDALIDRGVASTGGVRRDVLASMSFGPALAELARVITHQFRVVYARPQTLIPPESFEVVATAPGHRAYGTAARGQPQ